MDTHIVMVPSPGGPVPTPTPLPFSGKIVQGCCATVLIAGRPAATAGSVALNVPPHVPPAPGTFSKPPDNRGTIIGGSQTVLIGGKPAARVGDKVLTCADPVPVPNGTIVGTSTVQIGL
ncbi:PAAR domain-containing protein [Amycolatopsis sp. NBC_01488]|uniref:PAAR domain-containing protein n=1 Tax=Amycolatopsis sp. NBC_01488 TaxID=2903563 RepID=UPI002E2BC2ED|nr:PAAR domain-containing protein [Amycolatopsis sp. NBC_01488]